MTRRLVAILAGSVVIALGSIACGAVGSIVGNEATPGKSGQPQGKGTATASQPTPVVLDNDAWALVSQDADKYKGQSVTLTGEVFNVLEDSDGFHHFQMYTDPAAGRGNTHIAVKADPRVRKGYQVRVTGTVQGVLVTRSVSGSELRIPQVEAETVEVTGPPDVVTPTTTPTPTVPPTATPVPTATATPKPATVTPSPQPATTTPSPQPVTVTPTAKPASVTPTATRGASPTSVPPTGTPAATPSPAATRTPGSTSTATAAPATATAHAGTPSATATAQAAATAVATPGSTGTAGPGSGTTIMDGTAAQVSGPMAVGADPGAAGGQYIYSTVSDTGWDGKGNPPPTGEANFSVTVPHDGNYAIWAHLWYANVNANSYWLIVDNQTAIRVGNEDEGYRQWKWVGWRDDSPSNRIWVPLTAGSHTIRMVGREAGTRLDRVVVTDNGNTQQ